MIQPHWRIGSEQLIIVPQRGLLHDVWLMRTALGAPPLGPCLCLAIVDVLAPVYAPVLPVVLNDARALVRLTFMARQCPTEGLESRSRFVKPSG